MVSGEAPKKKPIKGTGKRLKYGSASMVVMVMVIAIVVVANLICGMLNKRYPVKLDLTGDKRYELTDDTADVLKDLDKDVEITFTGAKEMFSSWAVEYKNMFYQYYGVNVDMPYDIIPEILDKYTVLAEAGKGSISVKYVDINKDPDVLTSFSKNYSGDIGAGSMVFSCGDRVKVLSQNDVLGMITPSQGSSQNNIEMVFNGESLITANIMSVTDANPIRAAVITSYNENAIVSQYDYGVPQYITDFLKKNGYDCTDVDAAGEINPADYDLLVLPAPAMDFSEDIVAKFSDFLYNGGNYGKNMIYVSGTTSTNLTNISEFLADWKVQIEDAFVIDPDQKHSVMISGASYPTAVIADDESVGTLPNESLPIVINNARAVSVLSKNNETVVSEIIKSYSDSTLGKKDGSTETGEYDIVVKARKETASGINVYGSNLLVVGCSSIFDGGVLSNTNTYNNANVLLNIINNMTGKENGVIIPEKALVQNNISLETSGARVIQIVVIIVIPALIAIAGVIVLLRRKNR